jgi:hypothetical protein
MTNKRLPIWVHIQNDQLASRSIVFALFRDAIPLSLYNLSVITTLPQALPFKSNWHKCKFLFKALIQSPEWKLQLTNVDWYTVLCVCSTVNIAKRYTNFLLKNRCLNKGTDKNNHYVVVKYNTHSCVFRCTGRPNYRTKSYRAIDCPG